VARRDPLVEDPAPGDLFEAGVIANNVRSLKLPDGNIKVLLEGVERTAARYQQ
jgi:ATP-dependent Lon protease